MLRLKLPQRLREHDSLALVQLSPLDWVIKTDRGFYNLLSFYKCRVYYDIIYSRLVTEVLGAPIDFPVLVSGFEIYHTSVYLSDSYIPVFAQVLIASILEHPNPDHPTHLPYIYGGHVMENVTC